MTTQSASPPQWQNPAHNAGEQTLRSVTPAMNNTRGSTYGQQTSTSAGLNGITNPNFNGSMNNNMNSPNANNITTTYPSRVPSPTAAMRHASPSRYSAYVPSPADMMNNNSNSNLNTNINNNNNNNTPSSTGLIRLSLRKPMGIVFEPMYDPHQPSVQRGVRICDLPRTGAAALSRRLEIGDELLSINDKTMSRLTFDEIMDFIIEADPEQVHLLFRRPRKELLAARNQLSSSNMATTPTTIAPPGGTKPTQIKWVDHNDDVPSGVNGSSDKKNQATTSSRKKKHAPPPNDDDETLETYEEPKKRKPSRSKRDPYESESFLDLLIDTICANPDNVCRQRHDSEYYSEDDDDRTLTSYDDSTYVTYDSQDEKEIDNRRRKDDNKPSSSNKKSSTKKSSTAAAKSTPYEDDETLDTYEPDLVVEPPTSASNRESKALSPSPPVSTPLGLIPEQKPKSPIAVPSPTKGASTAAAASMPTAVSPPILLDSTTTTTTDEKNKAPIAELEYDDQIDHGADVSVMESLGGPSLLIEKQRMAAQSGAVRSSVQPEIIAEFGDDYPVPYGTSRQEAILADPLKFYTFVVKHLLEQHEPEKVRLLDKLLAKYKDREDHLVQKLSVRYKREETEDDDEEEDDQDAFAGAVNSRKEDRDTERAVQDAKQRMAMNQNHKNSNTKKNNNIKNGNSWPDKEHKEADPMDSKNKNNSNIIVGDQDDASDEEDSDFSSDSIDGTSPAVIAQVSELLNYVYGKTSVPGQIDRVSTIMRAYEGREAVLLELLETKALIKANSEKENAANLPSFLRSSPANAAIAPSEAADLVSPLSSPHTGNQGERGGNIINDDISSMSGVSSPAPEGVTNNHHNNNNISNKSLSENVQMKPTKVASSSNMKSSSARSATPVKQQPQQAQQQQVREVEETPSKTEKKKKGLFGGLFGKKNKNGVNGGGKRIRKRSEEGEI